MLPLAGAWEPSASIPDSRPVLPTRCLIDLNGSTSIVEPPSSLQAPSFRKSLHSHQLPSQEPVGVQLMLPSPHAARPLHPQVLPRSLYEVSLVQASASLSEHRSSLQMGPLLSHLLPLWRLQTAAGRDASTQPCFRNSSPKPSSGFHVPRMTSTNGQWPRSSRRPPDPSPGTSTAFLVGPLTRSSFCSGMVQPPRAFAPNHTHLTEGIQVSAQMAPPLGHRWAIDRTGAGSTLRISTPHILRALLKQNSIKKLNEHNPRVHHPTNGETKWGVYVQWSAIQP